MDTSESCLIDVFSPDHTSYEGLPARRAATDYDGILERYIERAKKVPGVVAVGRFGNIKVPGISDLDVLVVTEPTLGPEAVQLLSRAGIPQRDRQLYVHDPIILPEEHIDHLLDYSGNVEVTTLWGRPTKSCLTAGQDRRWYEISHVIERLPVSMRYFASLASQARVNAHLALLIMHALRYAIRPAAELLGEAPAEWFSFIGEIEQLRSEWFDLDSDTERIRRLAAALPRAWETTADVCFRLDKWILRENLLPNLGSTPFWSVFSHGWSGFVVPARVPRAWDFIQGSLLLNRPPRTLGLLPGPLRRRLFPYCWTIVPSFQFSLATAAVTHAPLVGQLLRARWQAGRLCEPMHPKSEFELFLSGRLRRLEAQAHFLERNGLTFGVSCSNLVFSPQPGGVQQATWRRRCLRSAALACVIPRIRRMVTQSHVNGERPGQRSDGSS